MKLPFLGPFRTFRQQFRFRFHIHDLKICLYWKTFIYIYIYFMRFVATFFLLNCARWHPSSSSSSIFFLDRCPYFMFEFIRLIFAVCHTQTHTHKNCMRRSFSFITQHQMLTTKSICRLCSPIILRGSRKAARIIAYPRPNITHVHIPFIYYQICVQRCRHSIYSTLIYTNRDDIVTKLTIHLEINIVLFVAVKTEQNEIGNASYQSETHLFYLFIPLRCEFVLCHLLHTHTQREKPFISQSHSIHSVNVYICHRVNLLGN